MNTVLMRRDVTKLGEEWHPVLRAYALAVGRMAELPATDSRSMEYQASVHGVGEETDPPPNDFQSQCQHNCWYFLPWHRWYLYYFEQIVRSMLADIDEIDEAVAQDWALPYWDYSQPGAAELPPEFASPTLWNGDPNPLFDPSRLPDVNSRDASVDPLEAVPPPSAFTQPFSVGFIAPSFGGSSSGWHHFREPGAVAGALEGQPHNTVHGFVGGNMWRFSTAGLDPVFWLHHCNIDRYWEVFGHDSDPSDWDGVEFSFRTLDGTTVEVVSSACVDTVAQLGYEYEDVSQPAPPTPGFSVRIARRLEMVALADEPPPDLPPEVVGTHAGLELSGQEAEAAFAVGEASDQFRAARGGVSEPSRVYLSVEDITGEVNPGISYAVYVDQVDDEQLAGLISFFGIEATRSGGHGLGYAFDITDIVAALRDRGAWDPADVRVKFVPVGRRARSRAAGGHPSVRIGNVSIAVQ